MMTADANGRMTRLARIFAELCEERTDASAVASSETSAEQMSLGEIIDRTQHAGFGFVAALLAIASVPLVGLTIPFGIAVAALGVQMIVGLARPWLPQTIRRRQVTRASLASLSQKVTKWTGKIAGVVRERWVWMTAGPMWTICGAAMMLQGLSLTLPVPGADGLFVVPIVLYGVGLLERDGLLVLVCHVITIVEIVLAVVMWEVISKGFADVWAWCAKTFA